MKTIDWKNILERAVWTFLEGFVVSISGFSMMGADSAALKAALIAAAMAGASALKTFVVDQIQTYIDRKQTELEESK